MDESASLSKKCTECGIGLASYWEADKCPGCQHEGLTSRLEEAIWFVEAIAARKHGTSHTQEWETIIAKAQTFLNPAQEQGEWVRVRREDLELVWPLIMSGTWESREMTKYERESVVRLKTAMEEKPK